MTLLSPRSSLAQATFRKDRKDGPVLVVVFLRGGADGLNVVVPFGEDEYYRKRPSLSVKRPSDRSAVASDKCLDLDGFFGLHPALTGLQALFHEGTAAFVQAVGSGDETRSHFEAMGTMERGMFESAHGTDNGWIARHIASTPDRTSPLRAVSFTQTLPDSLGGSLGAVAVPQLNDYKLKGAPDKALDVLAAMHQGDDAMARAGIRTLEVLKNLKVSDPANYVPDRSAVYPASPLGQALRDVAYLVKQDVGLEVACLESVGWDTHVAQGVGTGWQANLLKDLSDSVSAFYQDIGSEKNRVLLTVQTEFGRRLEENSGFGTDHGHGSFMMVAGGSVQGGKVYGQWPGLSQDKLVGPGDLAVTTDYRCVFAEVLEKHLGSTHVDRVFPKLAAERLQFLGAG